MLTSNDLGKKKNKNCWSSKYKIALQTACSVCP